MTEGADCRLMGLGIMAGGAGGWVASLGGKIPIAVGMTLVFVGGIFFGLAAPEEVYREAHSTGLT